MKKKQTKKNKNKKQKTKTNKNKEKKHRTIMQFQLIIIGRKSCYVSSVVCVIFPEYQIVTEITSISIS